MFRPAKFSRSALLAGTFFTFSSLFCATAAEIPAGTQLAKEQSVYRHLKDEPASLDPIKAVGLTEAQILRDLFEGLTSQGADGKPVPVSLSPGRPATIRYGHSACVTMPAGQTAHR